MCGVCVTSVTWHAYVYTQPPVVLPITQLITRVSFALTVPANNQLDASLFPRCQRFDNIVLHGSTTVINRHTGLV